MLALLNPSLPFAPLLLRVRCGLSSLPMSKDLLDSLATEDDLNNFLRSVFPTPEKSKKQTTNTSKKKPTKAPAPARKQKKKRAAVVEGC